MNKKVLSAILFSALFAGTGTFTSCIDTDEPAGIEELRGAKADLIRAKVAVEQANAAFKLAEAELVKAQAAVQNAIAKQNEALAENQRLQNELQEITNDSARAELEKQLAENEMELDSLKAQHEADIYTAKQAIAIAKRKYEVALAQIEIAQATGSEAVRVKIETLKTDVGDARSSLADAEEAYDEAALALFEAQQDAKLNVVDVKRYEYALAKKQADLKVKNEILAKWEAFAEEDETADWRAKIAEIEDSLIQIKKDSAVLALNKELALNSKEYKAYVDTVYAAQKALALEKDSLKAFKFAEGVTDTLLYTTIWNATDGEWNKEVKVLKGDDKTTTANLLAGANYLTFNADSTVANVAEEYGVGLISSLEDEIAGYTTEKIYWLDSIAKLTAKDLAATKKAADDSIAAYKTAKAAYEAAKTISTTSMATWADNVAPLDSLTGGAMKVFRDAINKTGATAADSVKAKQAFADALVAYYKSLPTAQVGLTSITLPITTNGRTSYVKKTVQAWLEDSSMKDVYLVDIIEYFDNDTTKLWAVNTNTTGEQYEASGAVKTGTNLTGAFSKFNNKPEMLVALQTASRKAFGEASQYVGTLTFPTGTSQNGYLHKEPTAADVKAVDPTYGSTGAYGRYLLSLDQDLLEVAGNHAAIVADLKAAKAKWTALLEEIVADAKVLASDIKAASDAEKLANQNLTAYEKSITETETLALYELGGEKRALEAIKEALIDAVEAFLDDSGVYTDNTAFAEWLETKVDTAQKNVFKAEKAVIRAEKNLAEISEGFDDYSTILTVAEREFEVASELLAEAQAELTKAIENLAKGLEILSAVNAAE